MIQKRDLGEQGDTERPVRELLGLPRTGTCVKARLCSTRARLAASIYFVALA